MDVASRLRRPDLAEQAYSLLRSLPAPDAPVLAALRARGNQPNSDLLSELARLLP